MRAGLAAGDQAIRLLIIIAGLLGLGLIVWLIIDAGAADVAQAMLIMGWALAPIALFHVVPLILSTLSWRNMLPANNATGMVILVGIRWLRESINNLLPVGSIGGDLVGARLVHQRGVPGAAALGSVVVDLTVGLLTQMAFAL
ncbi:MAG: lysylphosphatidylglycerol synthase domain-containing protein, partial [Rhodospirillaceae bacterium]|nr:lysylphosphatidylglycerol synthase domain-containing protein [Rhodospirillaceae bacterium]